MRFDVDCPGWIARRSSRGEDAFYLLTGALARAVCRVIRHNWGVYHEMLGSYLTCRRCNQQGPGVAWTSGQIQRDAR